MVKTRLRTFSTLSVNYLAHNYYGLGKMRIIKIELNKYNLFVLADFDKFTYMPEHKMALVLGTNGCGKSSLLRELSPLPASKEFFYENGYKRIEIEHHNSYYVLSSTFTSTTRHSFLMDGKELNPSGTGQVQKDLVKSHFNYTSAIHDLMIGRTNFTTMSVSERRAWFTQLSNINLTHALRIYNSCKNRQRDLVGGIKIQQSLKHNEERKLLSNEESVIVQGEIKLLTTKIDALMGIKEKLPNVSSVSLSNKGSLETSLDYCISTMRTLLKENGKMLTVNNEQSLKQLVETLNIEIGVLNERFSSKMTQLEELHDAKNKCALSAGLNEDTINASISKKRKSILDLRNAVEFTSGVQNVQETKNALNSLSSSLFEIFNEMSPNEPRIYGSSLAKESSEKYTEVKARISHVEESKKREIANISLYEKLLSESAVQCPKCDHIWSPQYDKRKHDEALKSLQHIEKELAELLSIYDRLSLYLTASGEYANLFRRYSTIRLNNPVLNFLWAYLDEHRIVAEKPRYVIQIINTCIAELDILSSADILEREITELLLQLSYVKDTNAVTVTNVDVKIQDTIDETNAIKAELSRVSQRLSTSLDNLSRIAKVKENINLLTDLIKKSGEWHVQETVNTLHLHLNEEMRALKLELNDKETKIHSREKQLSIVSNYENSIRELEQEKKVVDMIVDEVSPKDGLIGRIMARFIDKFIVGINSIIGNIWTYPFELIPIINEDETDLDYKFAARAEGLHVISDVSKCSSSMKEVIDLAFRLIAFEFLGFDKYPLFMDEFGASMDTTHRAKAFENISRILNSSDKYSQIYVISHHEQLYGSIRNADIVVLNQTNIVLPVNCVSNKNCTFT